MLWVKAKRGAWHHLDWAAVRRIITNLERKAKKNLQDRARGPLYPPARRRIRRRVFGRNRVPWPCVWRSLADPIPSHRSEIGDRWLAHQKCQCLSPSLQPLGSAAASTGALYVWFWGLRDPEPRPGQARHGAREVWPPSDAPPDASVGILSVKFLPSSPPPKY